jgi:Phytanoyl-CoA dioxygenase (PhyH)
MGFEAHRRDLPARLATAMGRAAARDVRGVPPIAFRLPDGRCLRFVPTAGGLDLDARDDAPTVVELDESAWRDFADEMATAAGLFYAGRVRFAAGGPAELERWEPALRALFSGRPILDPMRTALRDLTGAPLDLGRAFTLDDPVDDLRHFLHETGFLRVRRVFDRHQIARLAAVVERFQAAARPGDGRSWWATREDGSSVLCRLIYLGLASPAIAALSDDPRIGRLAGLAGEPLRPALDRSDGHSVVIKNAGVVEGLSDLPWHRDCGLGGHPITCPTLNVGVQLDAASAASGRLSFIPGSWRGSCHRHDLARAPAVAVDTEPGDCTVHFGDVMHAAPPPTGDGPGRRALYLTCMPARAYDAIPAGKSYNDVIRARQGGT